MVQGILAGGEEALRRSVEKAEDDAEAGGSAIAARKVSGLDVVFGITAGGTTPFVIGALQEGARRGARTVLLACVPREQAPDEADVSIRILTGPEVVTGSTRLKAGVASKMVLNTISTLAMVQLGKVHGNLMVDVNANGCAKLSDRAIRTTQSATGLDRSAAEDLLQRAEWHVKTAIVMHALSIDAGAARERLKRCDDSVRRALEAR
jgi:N-acetylmuramic acid 6-phosphate etherase